MLETAIRRDAVAVVASSRSRSAMGLDLAEAALVVRGSNNRCRKEDGARRSMDVGEWFLGGTERG